MVVDTLSSLALFLGETGSGTVLESISEPVLKHVLETDLVLVSKLLGLFYFE